MHRPRQGPSGRHFAATGLALLVHAVLLAALSASGVRTANTPADPTVLLTLAGDGGETGVALRMAAPPSRPETPAAPTKPPPRPSAAAAEVTPPPAPAPEMPLPASEPLDPPASEPDFEHEPDPSVTGDIALPAALAGRLGGDPGVPCPLVGVLRETLERDAAVQSSLERIPREMRSVAGAVVLWDGRWMDADRLGGAATIETVRAAIASGLSGASEACRAQAITGPVFLPIVGESGTLVLALGSGVWRWSDLLDAPFAAAGGPSLPPGAR